MSKEFNTQDNNNHPGKKIKNYILTSILGGGEFGTVWQAIDINKGDNVAIKIVPKKFFKENQKIKELFQCECQVLKQINNPNIVGYIDYFETLNHCYLILQYCNEGDMEQYLFNQKTKRISEQEAKPLIQQILNGYKALHQINVIHRDLKLANILIHNGQLKLADLGFAKQLQSKEMSTHTILGTSLTMAPEILMGRSYGFEADVYSLGAVIYQMVYGQYPFLANSDQELINKIMSQQLNFKKNGVIISEELKDLLKKMLNIEPQKRITWEEIYTHPLFTKQQNLFLDIAKDFQFADLLKKKYTTNFEENKNFYKKLKNQNNSQNSILEKFNQQKINEELSRTESQNLDIQQQQQIESMSLDKNNILENVITQDNPSQFRQQIQETVDELDSQEEEDLDEENQSKFKEFEEKCNHQHKIEGEIKKAIHLYLNERSLYSQLAKCVVQIHGLPLGFKINTYIPAFFLIKKVLLLNKQLISQIQKKRNIFNLDFFEEIQESDLYNLFQQQIKSDQEIIQMYYLNIQIDVQDQIQKQSLPSQEIVKEIMNEETGENFDAIFKETMMNYYVGLQEEHEILQKQQDKKDIPKILKHILQVLDCLNLNNVFKITKGQQIFDFLEYSQKIEELTIEQLNHEIEQKFLKYFDCYQPDNIEEIKERVITGNDDSLIYGQDEDQDKLLMKQ